MSAPRKRKKGNRFTSNLQLSIGSLVIALTTLAVWGVATLFWLFIGLSLFFLFIALIERSAIQRNELKNIKSNTTKPKVNGCVAGSPSVSSTLSNAGFVLKSEDGDEWYEKMMNTPSGDFAIQLSHDVQMAEKTLFVIQDLVSDPESMLNKVKDLQNKEADRLPGIENAIVKTVSFNNKRKPYEGEVYLESPLGESWACVYSNGVVTHLNAAD